MTLHRIANGLIKFNHLYTLCVHLNIQCNYMYVHIRTHMYICILAIDQVTGVTLTCEPAGLINQCTVMWNVSVHIRTYVRTYIILNI